MVNLKERMILHLCQETVVKKALVLFVVGSLLSALLLEGVDRVLMNPNIVERDTPRHTIQGQKDLETIAAHIESFETCHTRINNETETQEGFNFLFSQCLDQERR